MASQKLLVLDANALIHRAYHALPPLTSKQGEPAGALYGLCLTILNVLQLFKPTHIVAAFDRKEPTFRHKAYAPYKAQRKKLDDDLVVQLVRAPDIFRAFGIPVVNAKGYEADDIIGTFTRLAEEAAMSNVIVTGDNDTLQLIDAHTRVYLLRRGVKDTITVGKEELQERFGLTPAQMIDYKALRGDPSDNLPGVRGIGEKTATDLLQTYRTLEGIYENLEKLSPNVKTKLEEGKKDAFAMRKLVTILRTVPLKATLDDVAWTTYNRADLIRLLQDLGFSSLLPRIPEERKTTTEKNVRQGSLLGVSEDPRAKRRTKGYVCVQSEKDATALAKILEASKGFAFDTETNGLGARTSPLHGISIASTEGKAWYIPAPYVPAFKGILENPRIPKWGHNIKYDAEVLLQSGIRVTPLAFDTMLAAYILSPGTRSYGLDALTFSLLGHEMIPIEALIGKGKNQKIFSEVPLDDVTEYSCEDADYTLRLVHHFQKELKKHPSVENVFHTIEMPLLPALIHMELAGVQLDVAFLQTLGASAEKSLRALEKSIHKLAGKVFNINSPVQLRDVLFTTLRLPTTGIGRTQSGLSTAAEELDKLEGTHAIIPKLREYRELSKLKGTYLDALPELVDANTGRVYTTYNQTIAATGRLSSTDPNLQNIPIRTELGNEIRKAFVAEKGNVLLGVDYSQIELRLAAHVAKDKRMQEAFRHGRDIHTETAAFAYNVSPDKVTKDERRQAKVLNFGVLYGMGPQAFSRAAGVSLGQAQAFIDEYMRTYRGIASYMEEAKALAITQGYVETMYGRRRYLPDIVSRNPQIRATAERMAINHPLQGSASDIMKRGMIAVYEAIEKEKTPFTNAKLILQVHDELVFEVPKKDAEALACAVKDILEKHEHLSVPLIVETKIGKNWGEMKSLSL